MTSTYRSVTCSQVNDVILSQQALNAKHFRLPHNFKPIKTSTSRPFYFSPFGASWLHPWKPSHPPSQTLIGRHSATKGSDWLRRTPIKPPPSSPDFMGKKFEQSGHVTCEVAPPSQLSGDVECWCWRKFLAYPLKPEPKTTKEGFLSPGGTDVHADEEAGLLLHAWFTGADTKLE